MPVRFSMRRHLQAEWNALIPQARWLGITGRDIRLVGDLGTHQSSDQFETIDSRRQRLLALRARIAQLTQSTAAIAQPTAEGVQSLVSLTFGVEFECILPTGTNHSQIALAITAAGVPCSAEMYNHYARTGWKVVTDGSLGDYTRGAEIVSPVLSGDAGFAQVRAVCETLVAAGVKVNKRCGFHVHVGARNNHVDFFKKLVTNYAAAETLIDSFMSPSRRRSENSFCRQVRYSATRMNDARTLDDVARSAYQEPGTYNTRSVGRYCKLNLQSYWQHGTVEFRQHQGTIEGAKAEAWIRLCLHMCLVARANQTAVTGSLLAFLGSLDTNAADTQYFTSRAAQFEQRQQRQQARRAA